MSPNGARTAGQASSSIGQMDYRCCWSWQWFWGSPEHLVGEVNNEAQPRSRSSSVQQGRDRSCNRGRVRAVGSLCGRSTYLYGTVGMQRMAFELCAPTLTDLRGRDMAR